MEIIETNYVLIIKGLFDVLCKYFVYLVLKKHLHTDSVVSIKLTQ